MRWIRKPAPNGFPLHNEDFGVELSRPWGSLTVPFLKETMRLHSSNMIFLSETNNREIMVMRIQRQLHGTHYNGGYGWTSMKIMLI